MKVLPSDSYPSTWLDGTINSGIVAESPDAILKTSQGKFSHLKSSTVDVDAGQYIKCLLNRSRSEAGMSPLDISADGCERTTATKPEIGRSYPSTRINMLPVMASTGEAALEVGLLRFPKGRHWTSRPPPGPGKSIHMLPVFRLPEVSETQTSSFVQRLSRQDTQREREYRLKEAQELDIMKAALGLSDLELEALENELLSRFSQKGQKPAVTARVSQNSGSDSFDTIKRTCEFLHQPKALESKGTSSLYSFTIGKRQGQYEDSRSEDKYGSWAKLGRRAEVRQRDRKYILATLDRLGLDLPTPRVLQRATHSTRGGEVAPSTIQSSRYTSAGTRAGLLTSISEKETGFSARCFLGTTAKTEQLVAAVVDANLINLLELRRALGRSVSQVRCLAQAIQTDVAEIARICPVQHPRAIKFLRRCACERLATLADDILLSRVTVALERWRRCVVGMAMAERKDAYLRYQGIKKMEFAISNVYLRRLARGWIRWTLLVENLRKEECRAREINAAVIIQRTVRKWAARRYLIWLKLSARDRQRYHAAVAITRYAKGKVVRMQYGRMKADILRARAEERLRRVGRGMLGRRRSKRLKRDKMRLKVATYLQKHYRGRAGRRLFLDIKRAHRELLAASKIQSIMRGIWGRQRATRRIRELRETTALGCILRAARAWLARRLIQRVREDERRIRAIHTVAALNIQKLYRGHRTRILYGARLEMKRSVQRERNAAATKIQAMLRAHSSKRIVAKLSKHRKEQRIRDARLWVETWSEDAQAWFYYNAQIEKALWEPPITGYTKHDGRLVLESGNIVGDPFQEFTEEREEAKKQPNCAECEYKRATRKCDQCGDGYCTRCFRKTHAVGRRTKHTWAHVGPMECAECEAEVAIKWCIVCDDPFCGSCWVAIHSRGNRSRHTHCTISPGGSISTIAITADGNSAGAFTPGESLVTETTGSGEISNYAVGGGQSYPSITKPEQLVGSSELVAPEENWQEYADDNGIPYWYNSTSGVSQYESPSSRHAWDAGSSTDPSLSSASYHVAGTTTRSVSLPNCFAILIRMSQAADEWEAQQSWGTTKEGFCPTGRLREDIEIGVSQSTRSQAPIKWQRFHNDHTSVANNERLTAAGDAPHFEADPSTKDPVRISSIC